MHSKWFAHPSFIFSKFCKIRKKKESKIGKKECKNEKEKRKEITEMSKKNLYNSRVAQGITEEDRNKLIFEETTKLEQHLDKKTSKISKWAAFLSVLNTVLNLSIVILSAVIVVVTSINNFQNVTAIVCGGVIFAISGINQLLKLGDRGFNFRQAVVRIRRIRGQLRDILYMFHRYTSEQVLAYLSSFRSEIDDIDLDIYRASMTGEAKFGNGLRIEERQSNPSTPILSHTPVLLHTPPRENSHIHIHIDSPNGSPNGSPNNSPKNSPRTTSKNSLEDSPNTRNFVEVEEVIVNI